MKQSYWIGVLVFLCVFAFSTCKANSIHEAAKVGSVEQVSQFIAKGAEVNAKNNSGYTLLQIAAGFHNKNVAELLKKHGANE